MFYVINKNNRFIMMILGLIFVDTIEIIKIKRYEKNFYTSRTYFLVCIK